MKGCKLDEIEQEILAVLDECRREGLSKEEIFHVFSPLGITKSIVAHFHEGREEERREEDEKVRKKRGLLGMTGIPRKEMLAFLVILLTLGVLSYAAYPHTKQLRFQLLSLFRIGLIKILPVWKWTELYYSRCLVRNPFYEAQDFNPDDCNLCETLEDIERVFNVSQTEVIEKYIRREKPFIVTDAMYDWPIMKTDHLWFDNITEMYMHHEKIFICNLATNLRGAYGDFTRVVKQLYNVHTNQWFLHWENCQKDGAKAARQFYRRPYFISNSLDLTGSNWVLMSSDFKGRVYKKIDPSETLMMLYQIRGFNHIRLSPRDACRDHCPELLTTLNEGEILVVENLLWIMEYIPGEEGDNLGIISEVSWPSME